ncbi:hypothetical protein KPL47_17855 [Clostridium estertheticum]|uniref:hypothetical protein n=1 Tax=Clostridium estertheticum TaxID=238834 RepID=UPI001C0CE4DF|nr:hypothetical protein [Clostridium estertheticum]MBU3178195.1 hypothetical protein [Clostridium estertheticum]
MFSEGVANGSTASFILKVSQDKMETPSMLMCLAVWCAVKLKEETAKLKMRS